MGKRKAKEEAKPPTPPTLAEIAMKKACAQVEEAISGERASAVFVCGGKIPITKEDPQPVTCRWNPKDKSSNRVLYLPPSGSAEDTEELQKLVDGCEPASFGRGQENVMDPAYRKAGKLEPTQFLTNFCPIKSGIMDQIAQVLVPDRVAGRDGFVWPREVEAELYKLNVYSGPSGLFKKHVDTPRSENQIGSLVVCLPSSFKGGNLIVRHDGNEVDFAWEHGSPQAIQWAAFYSDCEHEIKKITEGHRITLTYNLFIKVASPSVTPGVNFDPKSQPLYGFLKDFLQIPAFMREGGVLGFFCSHSYPHASEKAHEFLPQALKGVDAVVYAVLHGLGINSEVLPVIRYGQSFYDGESILGERVSDDYCIAVGEQLKPYSDAENREGESYKEILADFWAPVKKYEKPIVWIGKGGHRKEALGYKEFGNAQEVLYSVAAIMAEIPPWTQRNARILEMEGTVPD